jgi:DNA-binding NarL/FixJ family response regulator
VCQHNQALVVDSHPNSRAKLKRCLERAFPDIHVDTAGGFSHARYLLDQSAYYVGLIAADLPGDHGFDLMALAQTGAQRVHVVATAADCDDLAFAKALRAGAEGFVLREDTEDDLVPRLRGLSRGSPPLSPSVVRHLMRAYVRAPAEQLPLHHGLTPKEMEVLAALAKGLRVRQVAQTMDVSENTVRTHVKHAYSKLNISSRAEAARAALRLGLI